MTDAAQLDVESETPVNPYSLLEAVNRSSDSAHMAWLIFLAIMAYLLIAVAGVSHKDLLLATPVQLPILGVEIQQVQFFQFAPVLLVLFHLGLVSQLALLARKTLEFDNAVRQLEPTRKRSHPLRLELHNFFYVQGIAGPHRSIIMGIFLHAMSWLTLVIIPVVLLLFIQISFLPYHSIDITWTHRVALVLDIVILSLLGVFLTRAETNFFQAFWRALLSYPVSALVTIFVLTAVLFVSFVVATIPGEGLDRSLRRYFDGSSKLAAQTEQAGASFTSNPFSFLFGRSDGSLFGLFHRNLIVTDLDLVKDREVSEGEPSLSLRGRDLRFARLDRSDLHQADFTGANLDGASLIGTNLENARLNCGDENMLILSDDRIRAKCASAKYAKLGQARMAGALMNGIDLRHADLQEADLGGATIKYAQLAGANFSSANLQKANLTGGVQAQGAQFLLASMEGADLTGAQLQYADLASALVQGATLAHAHLQGANLRDAQFDSADMRQVRLQGADLTGTNLGAADLRRAKVWKTLPPSTEGLKLADLRGLELKALSDLERETLQETIAGISDPQLRKNVADSLKPILSDTHTAGWTHSDQGRLWKSLYNLETPGVVSDYRRELTRHLVRLACKTRWSNGAVAEGISRRAVNRRFDGDPVMVYEHFAKNKSCSGGKNVGTATMNSLESVAESRTVQAADDAAEPPVVSGDVRTSGN